MLEEVNFQLESKAQEVKMLTESVERGRSNYQKLVWKLRDKAEKLSRVKNETDLVKKLLQGELAMVKHEFEQRCQFILDLTKRNERGNVKSF